MAPPIKQDDYEAKRPSKLILKEFSKFGTAQISDAMERYGVMSSQIKPLFENMSLCGPAFTVKCYPKDNLMCHYALKYAQPSDILVVDCGGFTEAGYWGEIMSLMARKKQLGGLVIDGGVRDKSNLRKIGFPIFSRAVFPGGTVKYSQGSLNASISCGGIVVSPGDIVIGDSDGVAVVPFNKTSSVLNRAKEILEKETEMKKQISDGKELFDLLGFQDFNTK